MVLNTFKHGTKLVWALWFSTKPSQSAIFSFEFINVCLCHDLSTHMGINETHNMELRLAIKFPTPPMSGNQMLCP